MGLVALGFQAAPATPTTIFILFFILMFETTREEKEQSKRCRVWLTFDVSYLLKFKPIFVVIKCLSVLIEK